MSTAVPRAAIRTIVASVLGMPESHVIWEGEPVPFVAVGALLVLDVVARRAVGVDEERREYPTPDTTRLTLRGQRVLTISVRASTYGSEEAFDLLERLRVSLGQDATRDTMRGAGVSFTDATNIQPLPGVVDNRAISVAQLDVTFNEAVEKVVDVASAGYIETVEMTGETELANAGTFEVDDPPDA